MPKNEPLPRLYVPAACEWDMRYNGFVRSEWPEMWEAAHRLPTSELRQRALRELRGRLQRANAIHEAGHGVIGGVVGLEVGHVTVETDWTKQSLGHASIAPWPPGSRHSGQADDRSLERARAIVSMAGVLAERHFGLAGPYPFFPDPDPFAVFEEEENSDAKRVLSSAMRLTGRPPKDHESFAAWLSRLGETINRIEAFTAHLIRRHATSIAAVAQALLIEGRIDGARLDALITKSRVITRSTR